VDRAGNAMLMLPQPAPTAAMVQTWRYAAQSDRWTPNPDVRLGTMASLDASFGLAVNRSGTVHAWWDGVPASGSGPRPLQARRFD